MKNQPDYSLGKIYRISNTVNDKIYIGSTTNFVKTRLVKHISRCKKDPKVKNSKLYKEIIELGSSNFKIELLESIVCRTKYELLDREQIWINRLKPKLNSYNARKP